jgi:hypothetical protein
MTVVYHIETHRNPRQVEHLVRTLVSGDTDTLVVIDQDRRFESPDSALLTRLGAVLHLSDGGYGDLTHVRRWLRTVQWLQDEGIDYRWLSNLSGQDYPVRSLAAIHGDLAATRTDAFVETFDVFDEAQTPWGIARGRTRYEFEHRRFRALTPHAQRLIRPAQALNVMQPWVRVSTAYGLAVGKASSSPWGHDVVLKGGSFFTTLRRPAVEAVRRFVDVRSDVMAYLEGCLAPEEVFFQTALGWAIEHDREAATLVVENDCRRYFDFTHTEFNHPKTLTEDDLPLAARSGADFARKFDDASNPGVLDRIDQLVGTGATSAAG